MSFILGKAYAVHFFKKLFLRPNYIYLNEIITDVCFPHHFWNLENDFIILENNSFALTTSDLLCTPILKYRTSLSQHFTSGYMVRSWNTHAGVLLSG